MKHVLVIYSNTKYTFLSHFTFVKFIARQIIFTFQEKIQ